MSVPVEAYKSDAFVNVDVIKIASETINNTGAGWIDMFQELAAVIFSVIVALELAREALNIAQGKEHNLFLKLVKYAAIGTVVGLMPNIASAFQKIPLTTISLFDFNKAEAEKAAKMLYGAYQDQGIIDTLFSGVKDILTLPLTIISMILYFVASVTTTITYVCYVFMFNLTLAMGPVAFAFLMSDDLKDVFTSWVTHIISYSITFPLIAIGVTVVEKLQIEYTEMKFGTIGYNSSNYNFMEVAVTGLMFSMMALGIIKAATKAATVLTGAGGGGELGAMGMGMVMGMALRTATRKGIATAKNIGSGGGAGAAGGAMTGQAATGAAGAAMGPAGVVAAVAAKAGMATAKVAVQAVSSEMKAAAHKD